MREPERWEELAADAALAGLSDAELDELDLLLGEKGAAVARATFERAAGEVAAAAFKAEQSLEGAERLPAALRASLEARLSGPVAEPPSRADANVVALAARAPFPMSRLAPWLVAAAAIVIAVVGWRRPPPSVPPPVVVAETPAAECAALLRLAGTARLDLSHTDDPAARQGGGDVVWHAGLQRGYMRIRGLAPNDPTKEQYQLWIFDTERGDTFPVDGGVFDVKADARGEVVVPIQAKLAVGKAKLFAITVERPGGVVVSKRERIVLTAAVSS